MHKGAPAFFMRRRVRLIPITTKPARVKTFMPKRISLVSTGLSPIGGVHLCSSRPARLRPALAPAHPRAPRTYRGILDPCPAEPHRHDRALRGTAADRPASRGP